MSKGRIRLNNGPAPNSHALSVSCRSAVFLCGGVPFLTLRRSSSKSGVERKKNQWKNSYVNKT